MENTTAIQRPTLSVLGKMRAYWLNITLWTARKKLVASDFNTSEDNLPPEDLASLGSKKICPPETIRIFSTLKARAVSVLSKAGIRFLGGYLVPEDKVFDVEIALGDIRKEFDKEKQQFLQRYSDITDRWIAQHPAFASSIRDAIDSPDYIDSRLQFAWENFALATTKQNKKFTAAFGKVADTLLEDIVKAAEAMWNEVFAGRKELTRKSLSPLRTLNAKLKSLSFIEPRIAPIHTLIQTTIDKIENMSPIMGVELLAVQGLVTLLQDTDKTLEYAQKVLDGHNVTDLIVSLAKPEPMAAYTTNIEPVSEEVPVPVASTKRFVDSCGLW